MCGIPIFSIFVVWTAHVVHQPELSLILVSFYCFGIYIQLFFRNVPIQKLQVHDNKLCLGFYQPVVLPQPATCCTQLTLKMALSLCCIFASQGISRENLPMLYCCKDYKNVTRDKKFLQRRFFVCFPGIASFILKYEKFFKVPFPEI